MDFIPQVWTAGMYYMRYLFLCIIPSGYDFGYLLKILTCSPMPADESEFFDLLRLYFPCIYDIKYLMRSCKNLKGGLQDIADDLQVFIAVETDIEKQTESYICMLTHS